jgi:hypothetical protein
MLLQEEESKRLSVSPSTSPAVQKQNSLPSMTSPQAGTYYVLYY